MKALHVYDAGPRYVLLRGPALLPWLDGHEIPAVRAPIDRGWKLHRDRLPDVLAMAAEDGLKVHLRATSTPPVRAQSGVSQ